MGIHRLAGCNRTQRSSNWRESANRSCCLAKMVWKTGNLKGINKYQWCAEMFCEVVDHRGPMMANHVVFLFDTIIIVNCWKHLQKFICFFALFWFKHVKVGNNMPAMTSTFTAWVGTSVKILTVAMVLWTRTNNAPLLLRSSVLSFWVVPSMFSIPSVSLMMGIFFSLGRAASHLPCPFFI